MEGFTCLIIFKNMFSFGLTFKAYDWIVAGGIKETFMVLASVQVVICLLSIPMCRYSSNLVWYNPANLNPRCFRQAHSQFLSSA